MGLLARIGARERMLVVAMAACIAAPLAFAQQVDGTPQAPRAAASEATDSGTSASSAGATSSAPSVAVNEGAKRPEASPASPVTCKEAGAELHKECQDLQAQKDMAKWARLMYFVTALGVVVSAIVAGFVLLTFRQTRRATEAARKAADAARDAVSAAEKNAAKQLRAYVWKEVVTESLVELMDGRSAIDLTIRNSGQSPAKKVRAWVKMGVYGTDHSDGARFADEPPESFGKDRGFIVNPHSSHSLHAESTYPLNTLERDYLRTGEMSYFLWGAIYYQDGFADADRVTTFFVWRRTYISNGQQMQIWCPCADGNDAT